MAEPPEGGPPQWEAAALVAALDPGIAVRLLAVHPDTGRCAVCGALAPCRMRLLAEAARRAPGPGPA